MIVSSFFIGISIGLKRAKAKEESLLITNYSKDEVSFEKIKLPEDIQLIPVGKNIEINGKNAELANFVTNRKVQELIFKQMAVWKNQGLEVLGGASSKRGYAIAFSKEKKERYALRAWMVPPAMRNLTGSDQTVQGIISYSSLEAYEQEGLVPAVPLMPFGKAGTLFIKNLQVSKT